MNHARTDDGLAPEPRHTIELDLSTIETRALAAAVVRDSTVPDPGKATDAHVPPPSPARPARSRALFAGVAAVLVTLAGIVHLAGEREVSVPTSASAGPHPAEPDPLVSAQSASVRFVNPFDPGEVFEFPPGTTEEDARGAVADILIQRAQERQIAASQGRARQRSTSGRSLVADNLRAP